ncbi:MAG TPA: hypothetical protein VIG73_02965 [Cerasibacillus sp.]|uniref:hypothetical protein n=1 Tax=Cerasibacillus sp. TaxID=2498711 RepID=UPI002F3FEDA2
MLEKFAVIIGVTSFLLNPYVKTLTYFPQHKTPLFSQCEQYSGHIDRFEGKDAIILLEDIGEEQHHT